MDSETVLFPSEAFVICLMFLLFFWTFAFIYCDSLLHRYQAPSTYSFKYIHNTHIFAIWNTFPLTASLESEYLHSQMKPEILGSKLLPRDR